MKGPLLIIIVLIALALPAKGQSITGTWVSSDTIACINFDSIQHIMKIEFCVEEGAWMPVYNEFTYKIGNDTLKIDYFYYGKKASTSYKLKFLSNEKFGLIMIDPLKRGSVRLTDGNDGIFRKSNTCGICRQKKSSSNGTLEIIND